MSDSFSSIGTSLSDSFSSFGDSMSSFGDSFTSGLSEIGDSISGSFSDTFGADSQISNLQEDTLGSDMVKNVDTGFASDMAGDMSSNMNTRMAAASAKTTDHTNLKRDVKQALKTGGPQAQAEVTDLATKIGKHNPKLQADLMKEVGVSPDAVQNVLDGPRMDESGRWFDQQGNRIKNPNRNPKLRNVADKKSGQAKPNKMRVEANQRLFKAFV